MIVSGNELINTIDCRIKSRTVSTSVDTVFEKPSLALRKGQTATLLNAADLRPKGRAAAVMGSGKVHV